MGADGERDSSRAIAPRLTLGCLRLPKRCAAKVLYDPTFSSLRVSRRPSLPQGPSPPHSQQPLLPKPCRGLQCRTVADEATRTMKTRKHRATPPVLPCTHPEANVFDLIHARHQWFVISSIFRSWLLSTIDVVGQSSALTDQP
jgi:hypothetical protein